jgi:hypothetical protein
MITAAKNEEEQQISKIKTNINTHNIKYSTFDANKTFFQKPMQIIS